MTTPDRPLIDVLVENKLERQIRALLDQYKADLWAEGYRVQFCSVTTDEAPASLRARLQIDRANGLTGAVLVGAIPFAMANKNAIARSEGMPNEAPPDSYWWSHPCDLYYMNLNGIWSDADGDGVFDRWSGDQRADIWVSRLRADTLASAFGTSEAALIERYLAKNHAYRHGRLSLPPRRAHVSWYTIDVLRTQRERSGWGCLPELIYGDGVVVQGNYRDGVLAKAGYLQAMQDPDGYELVVINCGTGPLWHDYGLRALQPDRVHWWQVRDLRPKRVLWYHMLTSAPGLHTSEPYLAGIYLFGDNPTLAVLAGTQHSGVIATPTLYPDLAAGQSFGEAWLHGARYEAEHWAEMYTVYVDWSTEPDHSSAIGWGAQLPAAVLHGDGTLRLPPFRPLVSETPPAEAI